MRNIEHSFVHWFHLNLFGLASCVQIVSKVENQEGMENFDDILYESDAIMVSFYTQSVVGI